MPTDPDQTPRPSTAPSTRPAPSRVNDPANPNAPRNGGGASVAWKVLRPGIGSIDEVGAYDHWWETNRVWIQDIMAANPDRADLVKATAWQYQAPDDLIDRFNQQGIVQPGASTGGGSGSRSGGGGGGGSVADQLAGAAAEVRNRARTLGLELNDDSINSLANVVVTQHWTSAQLDDYLVPGAQASTNPGEITTNVDQIHKIAASQLLNISDSSAREYAARISSGEMDMTAVVSLMQTQAAQRYGWAADQIGQGITVRDMMLPLRDQLASELEMAPEAIDLMDPKYLGMMQTADADGTIRAATTGEIVQRARKDPRYAATTSGRQRVAGVGMTLRKIMTGGE